MSISTAIGWAHQSEIFIIFLIICLWAVECISQAEDQKISAECASVKMKKEGK